ncbi:MAG: hypothetical protein ABI561_21090 [Bradyrhizobium sp.]
MSQIRSMVFPLWFRAGPGLTGSEPGLLFFVLKRPLDAKNALVSLFVWAGMPCLGSIENAAADGKRLRAIDALAGPDQSVEPRENGSIRGYRGR